MQFRQRASDDAAPVPLRVVPPPASQEAHTGDLARPAYVALIVCAIGLAVLVRATIVLSSDFPLNDGGMFFAMVRDLQASHYALPVTTTYNASEIPFAYPPLGMYAAALLDDATPLSLITVFRFLPLFVNALMLVAFVAFAGRMLSSRPAVATAVFVFGMLPATTQWMIMGGGLTRSFGFLFAVLTIGQVQAMYTDRQSWRVPAATVLASLVVLSHIEMAWLTALVCALMFVAYGRNRAGVTASVVVAVGTLMLTSPWWATVLHQHGAEPFLASLHSGVAWRDPIYLLIRFDATAEPLFALVAALGLLGMLTCVARRDYLLPAWVVAAAVLDPRAFPTSASMPLALLAAISVHDVLLPLATQRGHVALATGAFPAAPRHRAAPPWLAGGAIALGASYLTLSALVSSPALLTGLKADERAAMRWVAVNTAPQSKFAIISANGWSRDRTSEWFPVLAARKSVATVQGTEWLGDGAGFSQQQNDFRALQACANKDSDCLNQWAVMTHKPFDYVYITKIPPSVDMTAKDPCCASLRNALQADKRYSLVYDTTAASIFQRRP